MVNEAAAAGNSPSHKTRKRIVGSSLESRNYGVLPVGLLTCASTNRSAFPSRGTVAFVRPVLRAYSGGAVLDLHQLPIQHRQSSNESKITANGEGCQMRLHFGRKSCPRAPASRYSDHGNRAPRVNCSICRLRWLPRNRTT